jgi:opacity protein-like surface antigen
MSMIRLVPMVIVALLLGTASARADGYLTVYTGVNFGGDAGQSLDEALDDGSRLTWGVAVGAMRGGVIGAELDISRTSNFFGEGDPIGDNHVLTIMPALVVGIPVGGQSGPGVRPYATAGLGVIRRSLELGGTQVLDDNDLGYSLGVGINGYFNSHVGVRADYRFYRNLQADDASTVLGITLEEGTFSYSRATVGVLVRF